MDDERLTKIVDVCLGRQESIVFRALMGLPERQRGDDDWVRELKSRERKSLFISACDALFEQLEFELENRKLAG